MRARLLDCHGITLTRAAGFLPNLIAETGETLDLVSGTEINIGETQEPEAETPREEPETFAGEKFHAARP